MLLLYCFTKEALSSDLNYRFAKLFLEKTIDKHSELCYNIARWVCCYGSVGRAHPW